MLCVTCDDVTCGSMLCSLRCQKHFLKIHMYFFLYVIPCPFRFTVVVGFLGSLLLK